MDKRAERRRESSSRHRTSALTEECRLLGDGARTAPGNHGNPGVRGELGGHRLTLACAAVFEKRCDQYVIRPRGEKKQGGESGSSSWPTPRWEEDRSCSCAFVYVGA